MRGPIDVLVGKVGGFKKMEIARRTVPCYKHVLEKDGERLSVCLLVDSGKLYRFPYETYKGIKGLQVKARYLRGEMEHLRLRESSPDSAAMSKEQTRPSESLVQELLTERRELKVMVERLKLDLADAQAGGGGPDPRVREMQEEIERLRYQLASARAEVTQLREERDELRAGVEKALEQLTAE
jgi:chromosome segregation ATPase